jgi:HK97 family phage prohead protease
MAVLSSSARDNLPDTAFAYIEPGGKKVNGKTVPGSKRHFPIHDANHVRNALARAGQGARFAKEAMPKIMAAAKKHGVEHDEAGSTGRSLESLYPEVRYLSDVPEIRSIGEDQPPHIIGYAAAFNKLSRRLGGFVERVMPTAFNEARDSGWPDMVCRYNHKDDMVLGTTASGTLSLELDERGMRYDVLPPRHRADVVELVQRGDVRYSSFAFRCMNPGEDDTWGVTDYGFPMRSLHKVAPMDCAPVLDPAYRDTTAVARSMTGAVESLAMWVDAEPTEVRSMLEAGQAVRFFKRSDRPSAVPKAEPAAVPDEVSELRAMDDPTVALRNWSYKAEEDEPEPEADAGGDDSERAMHDHGQMCKQFHMGEPCVLGAGHEGDHANRCRGGQFEHGLPCAMAEGHGGPHLPMSVDDGAGRGPGRPRNRDGNDTQDAADEEKRTLLGTEALAKVLAMRGQLTAID